MADSDYIREIAEVWQAVKASFEGELPQTGIDLWFGEVEVLSFDGSHIQLGTASEMKHKVIQKRFLEKIRARFEELLGFPVTVDLSFTGKPVAPQDIKIIGRDAPEESSEIPSYNFEYTFENFIVGATNKFAHAACVAVANHPATNYNPLFIYGNSGLGKTHLLYATINRLRQNNPKTRIIYTKGEDFTNQMIACMLKKKSEDENPMVEFRNKYRKCDVLLIDDIQFIAGKVATQEEFFHTFNALFEEKKQIILTSDRPPREIKPLEERLKTRFEWGLIADIEPPDLELRIAIIKSKADQVNLKLPDEVLTFLAENLRSNIRQIEGAIKKLGALRFLQGKEITMEVAQVCLSEFLGDAEPVSVTVDKIFSAITDRTGITKADMTGKKREKSVAEARHLAVYLIRELTEMSFPNIGKLFDRDHSTILTSYQKIARKVATDSSYALDLNELKRSIG